MTHIKQTEECFDKIDAIKKKITHWVDEASCMSVDQINACEMGQAVDMIKDLACAQKDIWESCYYKTVVDAMVKSHEPMPIAPEAEVLGYNPNRNSMGRYTSGRSGYPMDPEWWRMGYDQMGRGTRSQSGSRMGYDDPMHARMMMDEPDDEGYGKEFGRYRQARRHYTETKSPAEKQKMEEHAEHHLHEAISTFKEIWGEADPTLRQKMKADLTKLMGEMN